ncbi:MAG TPA: oligosaccharide flippase family protein [Cyclobacteriaceae bacterium]|nr:oligosaccharide flippase family protein [Cyclobacteriaceae bacterium]
MISRAFIKSSFIYTIAGTLPMASAFILLPFYIHYLSTSSYGALSIYLTFSALVQVLVTYSFDTSLYIHFHELKNDKNKLSIFVSSAFIFMLIISVGVGLIFSVLGNIVFDLVLHDKNISFYPFGIASVGVGIFQSVFKVYSSLLQSRQKPEIFFWSNLLSFSLIAAFTIAGLLLFPGTLVGPVMGRLLAALISGSWALIMIFREFGIHFNFTWLKSSFSFNNYTFIYQLEQWVINNFDRMLMVMLGLPLAYIGVYDFAIKCLIVIELITNGLHSSFYPKMVSLLVSQKEKVSTPEMNRYYHGLIAVIMLLVCVCIFAFPIAIKLFVSKPAFQESIQYIPYLAVLYFFKAIRLYFTAPYGILKYSKPLPFIYLIISVLKIGLMMILIPKFNVFGVIFASFVGYVVELLLLKYNLRDKFEFRFNAFKIVLAPVLLAVLIMVLEPTLSINYPLSVHLTYLISCLIMLFWIYQKELKLIDPIKLFR